MTVASFSARSMGSPLRLQVAAGASAPEHLWEQVCSEFASVEAELSCYRADSALSQLNATAGSGRWLPASARLEQFLTMAERARRKTAGRFDPRVLADLVRLGQPGLASPFALRVDRRSPSARQAIRDPWLERDVRTRRVRISAPVDSGGLGKGLALRWAASRIRAGSGGKGALLEAGGDIVAVGRAPDGEPWQIGIEDPAGSREPRAIVTLSDGAICTSSTARQRWTGPAGEPVHHLLDPATGQPGGHGLCAVTVAGSDPAWAEVWTKSLFLAGPARIGGEARARGLAAWWIEADGTLRMTPAARQRTAWLVE